MNTDGMNSIPAGHLPAVVIFLQMTAPAMDPAKPFPADVTATCERLDNDSYRAIYRAVGAPWLWSARLALDDAALAAVLNDENTESWIIRRAGQAIGLIELDFRTAGECELAYFGIVPEATGQGLGGPMMALAQRQAFAREIDRFFVHTCNWDDPRALAFYQKAGFVPYKYGVDIGPDPRLDGTYPPTTASQIPCLK